MVYEVARLKVSTVVVTLLRPETVSEFNETAKDHLTLMDAAKEATSATTSTEEKAPRQRVGRYPLQYTWCLYFLDGTCQSLAWEERLDKVAAVSCLEQFGVLYQSMKEPSSLKIGTDFYFFKQGILPRWDHEQNRNGGRWIIPMDNRQRLMDTLWMRLLMSAVGNWYGDLSKDICGFVVNIRRRRSKLCVWTRNGSDERKTLRIGHAIKRALEVDLSFTYEMHEDCEMNKPMDQKVKYTV
ncbi:translation initiation factor 4E [Trichuris trichiura]|uniref:Translation initiation factor 4E n=1 Tax=Trichuris trichiura TaxID=36087 RepID=A0A077Z5J1_TRITR|nr:translation initiation factor 4E [Trichuris trichiura]